MSKTIYTTVSDDIYEWLDRIRENRKDKGISATVRYILEKLHDIVTSDVSGMTDFIEELRRWGR